MIQKEQIKSYLLQVLINPQVVSGGNELACSCPFCGEQRPKLYIGPFNEPNEQIRYHCFKCKVSGIVDQSFLESYGVSNVDSNILTSNKGVGYKTSRTRTGDIFHNISWNYITQNELSDYKLQYINKRLGTKFTYSDCVANKIVLNVGDVLEQNNITFLTRRPDIVQQLNMYFIGFLSRSNSGLNMRNIISGSYAESKLDESLRQKYINYKIFSDTAQDDFYILPANINPTQHIKVYIAEGPFDALGIKYNLIKDDNNCIYIAGRGKAYDKSLYWVIRTLAPFDMEVHFFPDADVDTLFIQNIARKYAFYGYQFFLHRNGYRNEKDFGVPQWKIDDIRFPIREI